MALQDAPPTTSPRTEHRVAQDAATLLASQLSGQHPAPTRDWLWDGLSPQGRAKLVDSWMPPGLRAQKNPPGVPARRVEGS